MKAIALISGGLDSILAARLIKEQGIEVVGLKFKIPFYSTERKNLANLGIEIKEIDIGNEFLELIKNPKYGYGSNINPCIDCKILMLNKAKGFMEQSGGRFIITGEVLGQRPMSGNRKILELVEKESELEGFLLRPLSAKLLTQTIPEREGWVSRVKLLSLNGRGRRAQIELARAFNIKEYAQPAGGCLLTDPQFAKRIKDILKYRQLNLDNIELLKIGRHFRLSPNVKLVIGRDERENKRLINLTKKGDYLFLPKQIPGPTALGRGDFSDELIRLSCNIICRYCDLNANISTDIIYKRIPEKENTMLGVSRLQEAQLINIRI